MWPTRRQQYQQRLARLDSMLVRWNTLMAAAELRLRSTGQFLAGTVPVAHQPPTLERDEPPAESTESAGDEQGD